MLLLAACNSEADIPVAERQPLTISSEVLPYDGEPVTRANEAGTAFETNDMIRLKVICPYVTTTLYGESTWGNTMDSFWLLKWNGSGWTTLSADDYYDITGSYSHSGSSDIFSIYESQPTPYVYTAITWTEEKMYKDNGGKLLNFYSNVFHTDQHRLKNYKASDVLWAQQYAQTGTYHIRLTFQHVMTSLLITINDDALPAGEKISDDAVLTMENMPDIDQAEIVIGDYYAAKDKSNYTNGYKVKSSCAYKDHGKVLGIADQASVDYFSGGAHANNAGTLIPNTATYTCYHIPSSKQYRVIVPPCVLDTKAEFWLRDDTRRYKMVLDRTTFEQGKLYPITMKVGV